MEGALADQSAYRSQLVGHPTLEALAELSALVDHAGYLTEEFMRESTSDERREELVAEFKATLLEFSKIQSFGSGWKQ